MRVTSLFFLIAGLTMPFASFAQDEVSVERGLQISIMAGCHDCHTEGYSDSKGKIDPEKAFMGSSVGWRGPWGTSYSQNLRAIAQTYTEDGFVRLLKHYKALPPMPWYNLAAFPESDMRSLYQYIKSLGEPGGRGPNTVLNPNVEPRTPYIQLAPPQMPKS